MKRRNHMILLSLVIAAALALVFSMARISGSAAGPDAYQDPNPPGEEGRMEKLRGALDSGELSPDAENSVREKLEMAERMAAQQENGAKAHSTKVPMAQMQQVQEAAPALESNLPAFEDVIFEGSEGLVRPWEANILNGFEGLRGDIVLQILAGSHAEDAGQGVLYVFERGTGRPGRTAQVYSPEQATGALLITAVEGMRVMLESESAGALVFNLETRSFE